MRKKQQDDEYKEAEAVIASLLKVQGKSFKMYDYKKAEAVR